MPCTLRSTVSHIRLAQATHSGVPEPKSKTQHVAKARCCEIGRAIANNKHQKRVVEIGDDNVTSGCCINQHTGEILGNNSTKTPWHAMFPQMCPPSSGKRQPYANDA